MKSHANGPLSRLMACIISDAAIMCAVDELSMKRDIAVMQHRVMHEGLSFLTITLPNFAGDFERSLEQGKVFQGAWPGWTRYRSLPAFLRGFSELVFSAETGLLLDEPSIAAIYSVRQICLAFKKVALPCSPHRVSKAIDGYVEIEQCLESHQVPQGIAELFCQVSAVLWGDVFGRLSEDPYDYLPKHGPGATCERVSGNRKYAQRLWYERLERLFPMDGYVFTSVDHMLDSKEGLESMELVPEDQELPVRVITVPKTLKAPRIIAIEPVCMQYAQQAVSRQMVETIERHWLTSGHVNFTDQGINQRLAMDASLDSHLATLDMSSASDRVPLDMVKCMFAAAPQLLERLLACRSRRAQLPDGRILDLHKFASMGSATCFPVEACYFFTGVVTALLVGHVGPVTVNDVCNVSRGVYVYGDDLVVPADATGVVVEVLTALAGRVNASKSFVTGRFRESCGVEAYAGESVTPVYVRQLPPTTRQNAGAIISWCATANLFYEAGMWRTAEAMKMAVERITGNLPVVQRDSAAIGCVSFQRFRTVHGWHKDYQTFFVKAWTLKPKYVPDQLDGYAAVLKCLLLLASAKRGDPLVPPSLQHDHLQQSVRSGISHTKRRKVPVF